MDSSCCLSTAQESDSCSNVSLAPQFFSSLLELAKIKQIEEEADNKARLSALSCDRLAANPSDQRRRSTGVSYEQLRTQLPDAIQVCGMAAQRFPNDLTLQYQLARAMGTS